MANRVVEEEGWDERELGADWSSDLEAVLYAAEVEEAISEVRLQFQSRRSPRIACRIVFSCLVRAYCLVNSLGLSQ